jgi:hypothetical protein
MWYRKLASRIWIIIAITWFVFMIGTWVTSSIVPACSPTMSQAACDALIQHTVFVPFWAHGFWWLFGGLVLYTIAFWDWLF